MIREAIDALGGTATNSKIRDYINSKYKGVNQGTINCQIISCTVNRASRVRFPKNFKPRKADTEYDFLYSVGRSKVILYKPEIHGDYEIAIHDGKPKVLTNGGIIDNSIECALLEFIQNEMEMDTNYQPIIIKTLLESGNENRFESDKELIQEKLQELNFEKQFDFDNMLESIRKDLNGFVTFGNRIIGLHFDQFSSKDIPECLKACGQKIAQWHMDNYQIDMWSMLPGRTRENYPFLDEFLQTNSIGVGWNRIKDISDLTKNQILKEFNRRYPEEDSASFSDFTRIDKKDLIVLTRGQKEIVDYGIVTGDYHYESKSPSYTHRKKIVWLKRGPVLPKELPNPTLEGFMRTCIKVLKRREELIQVLLEKHTVNNIVPADNYTVEQKLEKILDLKKQLILYGPPGTGKTYHAMRLAQHLIRNNSSRQALTFRSATIQVLKETGKPMHYKDIYQKIKDQNLIQSAGQTPRDTMRAIIYRDIKHKGSDSIFKKTDNGTYELNQDSQEYEIKFSDEIPDDQPKFIRSVTFHQSYSYEDFIEGIRPTAINNQISYDLEDGIFKQISEEARADPLNKYVLVIDEINRGNISKIFGELITSIEKDKRENHTLQLAYSKEEFTVPKNLFIIGTMNTADRSLIQIDTALRRRFSFHELMPEPELLSQIIEGIPVRDILTMLNQRIKQEGLRERQIGHSYFMSISDLDGLQFTFAHDIVPLLQDYFFDDYKKLENDILSSDFVDSDNMKIKTDWHDDPQKFLEILKNILQQ